jgi:hypothetical protein
MGLILCFRQSPSPPGSAAGRLAPQPPTEWPWSYVFLAIVMFFFALHAAGRSLGLDAWLRRHVPAVRDGPAFSASCSTSRAERAGSRGKRVFVTVVTVCSNGIPTVALQLTQKSMAHSRLWCISALTRRWSAAIRF